MIDQEQVQDILRRLRPATDQEGLEVELLGIKDGIVELRARRRAPGAPTAFVIRAIEGTYRRYLPEVKGVQLKDYDPGPAVERPPRIEDTGFAALVAHAPGRGGFPAPLGIPGVNLADLDRAEAVRALEAFLDLWGPRGVPRLKVVGLDQDAPARAYRKWKSVYCDRFRSEHPVTGQPGARILHLGATCQDRACAAGEPEEIMPGRILLTRPEPDDVPASGPPVPPTRPEPGREPPAPRA